MAQAKAPDKVEVTAEYLPATKPFHGQFTSLDTVQSVLIAVTAFFGVGNFNDGRDQHDFWLEFEGNRLTDPSATLESLLGPHRRGAHLNLVEQITKGAV